ncbi:hypothetical protein BDN72DRAFT_833063 [Pluteus cervinus]|uniref:Uncharacterized protein n=1 Tax=Pluteus cervinus TaxID=181527 RepID=A0ACD3B8D4_9AGAR|nr:hypothetical protein BDN72DRAFT_833063 [Pluteus cervinus]
MRLLLFTSLLALLVSAFAETFEIKVGANTTNDPSKIFQPQSVNAQKGDVVTFTFVQGNHTATQSTFGSPCTPAHVTNATINGFDSGFRDTVNGTAVTTLSVTITDPDTPIWFYDANTCSEGGVGAININSSSDETLAGFSRNAVRLNGTEPSSSSTQHSASQTSNTPGSSQTSSNNGAQSRINVEGYLMLSMVLTAIASL